MTGDVTFGEAIEALRAMSGRQVRATSSTGPIGDRLSTRGVLGGFAIDEIMITLKIGEADLDLLFADFGGVDVCRSITDDGGVMLRYPSGSTITVQQLSSDELS
jgi:hypothetical protein